MKEKGIYRHIELEIESFAHPSICPCCLDHCSKWYTTKIIGGFLSLVVGWDLTQMARPKVKGVRQIVVLCPPPLAFVPCLDHCSKWCTTKIIGGFLPLGDGWDWTQMARPKVEGVRQIVVASELVQNVPQLKLKLYVHQQ